MHFLNVCESCKYPVRRSRCKICRTERSCEWARGLCCRCALAEWEGNDDLDDIATIPLDSGYFGASDCVIGDSAAIKRLVEGLEARLAADVALSSRERLWLSEVIAGSFDLVLGGQWWGYGLFGMSGRQPYVHVSEMYRLHAAIRGDLEVLKKLNWLPPPEKRPGFEGYLDGNE